MTPDAPQRARPLLYTGYPRRCDRPQLRLKDLKDDCFADRLSCHRFWANQCRLLLHSAAYWVLDPIRRWLEQRPVTHIQLGTLRLRLIKVGGWVRQHLDRVTLHFARCFSRSGSVARAPPCFGLYGQFRHPLPQQYPIEARNSADGCFLPTLTGPDTPRSRSR